MTYFYSKDRFLCFLIASHKQTEKTNRINGLYTFCKVWTFKSHLISDYSNYCSSSSSHSPFSVSDKTSDESDTTTGSSRVAAIIDYMHGRVWICNASCRHLESCRVTRLFPFIHDRWPCLSLDKKTYGGGGGGGRSTKKKIAQGEIKWKKILARQLTLKNIHAMAYKKIHTRNLISKKNSCGSKINPPPPPQ